MILGPLNNLENPCLTFTDENRKEQTIKITVTTKERNPKKICLFLEIFQKGHLGGGARKGKERFNSGTC